FSNAREAERSLVRRLLTHERAETIIAGLLREYFAANGTELSGAARVRIPRQLVPPPPEVRAPRTEKLPADRVERAAPIKAERSEESAADRARCCAPCEADARSAREPDARGPREVEARGARDLDVERSSFAMERGRLPEPP